MGLGYRRRSAADSLVATVAALVIVATLSVSVATVTTTGTAGTADVSVVFVAADGTTVLTPATVYSVDVIFDTYLSICKNLCPLKGFL